ncbi:MAG: hypothetical protein ABIB97_05550 [Patescibacteria group bacterium]
MADINLLKDTESAEEGRGLHKEKAPSRVEFSKPEFKAGKKKSLTEKAPEGVWSRMFGSRKKKAKSEKPQEEKGREFKKPKVRVGRFTTSDPIVMSQPGGDMAKEGGLKAVRVPEKPHLQAVKEIEFFKSPEAPEETLPEGIVRDKKDLEIERVITDQPSQSEDKKGFFARFKRKPKKAKPPKIKEIKVPHSGKTHQDKIKEIKVPQPITPSVSAKEDEQEFHEILKQEIEKEKLEIPPEPKKEKKVSWFKKLFRKPKVDKIPEAVSFDAGKMPIAKVEKPEIKIKEATMPLDTKTERKKSKEEINPIPSVGVPEKKEGFFGRMFKKPKVEKVPEATSIAPLSDLDKEIAQEAAIITSAQEKKEKKVKKVAMKTNLAEQAKMTEVDEIAPSALDVNLMPEDFEGDMVRARKSLINLGLIALGSVIFFVLVYLGLMFYESSLETKTSDLKSQIASVNDDISQYREVQQKAIRLQQKTKAIKELISNHIYWTNFFTKIEEYTIDNVYYDSFSGDLTSGRISLAARAKTFLDVGRQLLVFQEAVDFVENVEIKGATLEEVTVGETLNEQGQTVAVKRAVVNFNVTLDVIPQVFKKLKTATES